jgi:hypothetical protein
MPRVILETHGSKKMYGSLFLTFIDKEKHMGGEIDRKQIVKTCIWSVGSYKTLRQPQVYEDC